jgi:hypothetical protein
MRVDIIAELDVFSGRPNPSWKLSQAQAEELKERLRDGPETEGAPPNRLGYRGVVVTARGGAEGLPEEVRACGGVIFIREKKKIVARKDVRDIEGWLLAQAKEHGYGDIVNRHRERSPK